MSDKQENIELPFWLKNSLFAPIPPFPPGCNLLTLYNMIKKVLNPRGKNEPLKLQIRYNGGNKIVLKGNIADNAAWLEERIMSETLELLQDAMENVKNKESQKPGNFTSNRFSSYTGEKPSVPNIPLQGQFEPQKYVFEEKRTDQTYANDKTFVADTYKYKYLLLPENSLLSYEKRKPSKTGNYTVQKNDSLWKLAERFNTTIGELARLNNIDAKNLGNIYEGEKLFVPEMKITYPEGSDVGFVHYPQRTTKDGRIPACAFYTYELIKDHNGTPFVKIKRGNYDDTWLQRMTGDLSGHPYQLWLRPANAQNQSVRFDSMEELEDAAVKFATGQVDFDIAYDIYNKESWQNFREIAAMDMALRGHAIAEGYIDGKVQSAIAKANSAPAKRLGNFPRKSWRGYGNVLEATNIEKAEALTRIRKYRVSNKSSGNVGYLEGTINDKIIDERMWHSGNVLPGEPQIFKATKVQGNSGNSWVRNTDTEFKMLNQLASDLGAKPGCIYPEIIGELRIVSEHPYCASCLGVITQFSEMFPNVKIVVLYP